MLSLFVCFVCACVAECIRFTCKKCMEWRVHENALPATSGMVVAGHLSPPDCWCFVLHV